MLVDYQVLEASKAASRLGDYEDAWRVWPAHQRHRGRLAQSLARKWGRCDGPVIRVSVADGATEGLLSREWATRLTAAYCGPGSTSVTTMVNGAAATWRNQYLPAYRRKRAQSGRPVAWYEEPGLEKGAFATWLGVTLKNEESTWEGSAVGDCAMFQVRHGTLVRAFPISSSREFGTRPALVATGREYGGFPPGSLQTTEGSWTPGDAFFLMSDALAKWTIIKLEEGLEPWPSLISLLSKAYRHREAVAWVEEQRRGRLLRDDDVTLVCASVALTA